MMEEATEYIVRVNIHSGRRGRPRFMYEGWDAHDGYQLVSSWKDAFRYSSKPDPNSSYFRGHGRIEVVPVRRRVIEEVG